MIDTGWLLAGLQKVGERRLNMLRMSNAREGLDRAADTLPEKFFKRPLKGGPSDGWRVDAAEFEGWLDKYFELCGWDVESGVAEKGKLEELGLGWLAEA